MKLSLYALAMTLAVIPVAAQAQTTTINFSGLDNSGPFGGNGKPFATYTEKGFTFQAPGGQYVQGTNGIDSSGNSLLTGYYNGTQLASLTVTSTGTFNFSGFDLFLNQLDPAQTASTYSVFGYLGGVFQYYAPATAVTVGNNHYNTGGISPIDQLVINTNSPGQLYVGNFAFSSAAIAAVPEPATWAMLIAGFGVVGVTMRRRKTAQVATYA